MKVKLEDTKTQKFQMDWYSKKDQFIQFFDSAISLHQTDSSIFYTCKKNELLTKFHLNVDEHQFITCTKVNCFTKFDQNCIPELDSHILFWN